ncbi:MAG: FAD-binding oxidoreductase, partial [Bacteroidales bacterium]|nr:FAD-binding oxidoreductase [Bacteroidales bacterium]
MSNTETRLEDLGTALSGDLKYDKITRTIYSTDASVYKEEPLAVAWPRNPGDIKKIIEFAAHAKTSIIPRAGGTSLAGQVVGRGIVVDVSRYMNRIIEINTGEKWVRVEPGVVLDELNMKLKDHGLFFGPETSTSNRCNIGGMIGNNACGSHSIIYGSTRDHLLEVTAILSDGSDAVFSSISPDGFREKCRLESLEGKIYRNINTILGNEENRASIRQGYPERSIERRNTGYALDLLIDCELFDGTSAEQFNMCRLLAGSEGTLAFITEAKLNLVPLPPTNKALVCVHLEKRNDAFRANLIALKYKPSAVEMMDDRILSLTEDNLSQRNNRFFLEGHPAAIVIVEFMEDGMKEIDFYSLEELLKVEVEADSLFAEDEIVA